MAKAKKAAAKTMASFEQRRHQIRATAKEAAVKAKALPKMCSKGKAHFSRRGCVPKARPTFQERHEKIKKAAAKAKAKAE